MWQKQRGEDNRFILHIPKSEESPYEKWFNVAIKENNSSTPMVAAQIGVVQDQAKGTYTPFFRTRSTKTFHTPLGESGAVGGCRQCHISGIHDVFVGVDKENILARWNGSYK